MARFIPLTCDTIDRPQSEQIVFDAIKSYLSDNWIVFHSLDFIKDDQYNKRWDGEIDFLLYHPNKGILVLEVKGGKISYQNGTWYQNNHKITPILQSKRNKYAIMQLLQKNLERDVPIKFAHSVCFPNCAEQTVWPLEAQGIVLTNDKFSSIELFASKILADVHMPGSITGKVSEEEILQILSPKFKYGCRLFDQINIEEKQFIAFTEQQCVILDALENFKQLKIEGCAGSGKTIMAVKKAKQLAAQGKNVLLLCYNKLLAQYLKKSVQDIPNIQAVAFFEFCIEVLNIPAEQIDKHRSNSRLYSEVLPKALKKYLSATCMSYDAVIVDEGQDFASEAWDVIGLLPDSEGYFYIFYDPNQNIYQQDLQLPDFHIPPVTLNKNCRNTKNICEALVPYLSTTITILESSPTGTEVNVLNGDAREELGKELERLCSTEGVSSHDIVILGAHSLNNTSVGDNPKIKHFTIVDGFHNKNSFHVSYYTYMKFKGCESKVIILLDVDENDLRWQNKNCIYTAMSRAVHHLSIIKS